MIRRAVLIAANILLAWRLVVPTDVPLAPVPSSATLSSLSLASTAVEQIPDVEDGRPATVTSGVGNLFRPATMPPGPAVAALDALSGARLLGVVSGQGQALAVVRSAPDADPVHVRVGDSIAGWQVVDVALKAVVLARGNQRRVLALDVDADSPATPLSR